ncbi:MAG TPA: LLM class flavin-dependent oxidoreductase [Acidimicrobiia bacterium]|nr:LLM class flavin-dependent oxidoreductase [Acidimicrobiia bacterium]
MFSIMTEPHLGGTYDQMLAATRLAERKGLVSFARCDHYLSRREPTPDATDAFATLAGLARDTSTIRLCVLVSPITFRHPAVIAKNAATIDQMSGGRFDLGVGTGWMDYEHASLGLPFPGSTERWARFEEALDYLAAAFGPGRSSFEGKYYRLDAEVRPKPLGLRVVIGGDGMNRTPRLAGARAEEYNFFICSPTEARLKIEVMREAAGDRQVEATVMGAAVVGATETEYRRRLGAFAERFGGGSTPVELEEEWRGSGVIFGVPDQAAEQVAALEAAGVERIYLQWLDLADYDGLAETVDLVCG